MKYDQKKIFSKAMAIVVCMMLFMTGCTQQSSDVTDSENKTENQTENTKSAGDKGDLQDSKAPNEEKENKNKKSETENNSAVQNVNEAELHFINTGNSDAILIKQGENAALIDGGDNDDEKLVVNYLKNQGVKELEYVFATHPHADHIGGLDAVVSKIPVKHVYVSNGDAKTKTYRDFIYAMSDKGLYPSVPLLNSEFKLGTSMFEVLSVANTDDPNNNSIVLEYTNGYDKILLMGDADKEIESKINVGKVDLLKVGHHGSRTASSKSFIDKIQPKYAVMLVGKNNDYGHPHQESLDVLKSDNVEIHRSDECGDIVFKSTGKGLVVNCAKGSFKPGDNRGIKSSKSEEKSSNSSAAVAAGTASLGRVGSESANSNNSGDSQSPTADTVYWTPGGKVYHSSSNCKTLQKSKNIKSGTISESGKSRACRVCY
ncbi:MAG: MBL fold metallo-hydrolase [Clostridioides sp.]|jgi:beta-lactamase superfamily II metal-dependent hydrolase|nr:MBL fold metallo-hydrolase [Clostridioides sp.]